MKVMGEDLLMAEKGPRGGLTCARFEVRTSGQGMPQAYQPRSRLFSVVLRPPGGMLPLSMRSMIAIELADTVDWVLNSFPWQLAQLLLKNADA
jgi:hypothetical protein